ncbi:MAG: nicotinate-nucleotide--dimethylbenzimidazole phosphoribosyltransferase [Clostridiales bacterium]|jgi:nicotinate-nucleotide--dimethylbenzimidazole phosphoribosyltransferase|nr:nicotinate-nucleotide--dimethylbenzimidazole phosphoribosyltransferase [Clostridiales bacterium]
MNLESILKLIKPADSSAYDECIRRFNSVAKPIGSLGGLETLLARVAAIHGGPDIDIGKKCALVFCADNGVVSEGVTAYDAKVTTAIGRIMASGKSSVCVMAQACGAQVFAVDIGMRDTVDGLIDRKLSRGTENIAVGRAMSRETAIKAIEIGADFVRLRQSEGYRLIAVGETGMGNTTTASAVASVLLNRPAAEVVGRGAGLSDEGLLCKRNAVERAIAVNRPNPDDPIDVIAKLGGLDIAAMAGAFIGGAAYGAPMAMDGVISAAAALCAVRMESLVRDYIIPSHISAEPASGLLCGELRFEPVLNAGMRLGEGAGAVALFPVLDLAAAVYRNAATFDDLNMEE